MAFREVKPLRRCLLMEVTSGACARCDAGSLTFAACSVVHPVQFWRQLKCTKAARHSPKNADIFKSVWLFPMGNRSSYSLLQCQAKQIQFSLFLEVNKNFCVSLRVKIIYFFLAKQIKV